MANMNDPDFNTNILICDDNDAIHKDFLKVLNALPDKKLDIDYLEEKLFEDDPDDDVPNFHDPFDDIQFHIDSAYQGKDALHMAEKAAEDGKPYSVIFMDVRMPPGWDGILTAEKIWQKLPYTEIVIVTAYSDYTWEEMIDKLGFNSRLLFIKKPFDTLTVKQLALNLTNKWNARDRSRRELDLLNQELLRSGTATTPSLDRRLQELKETLEKI
ncbi:MAG: response regulator [Acidobacteriota bacterium]|nr:response regulator [Acidobacteriota bacterium]